MSGLFDDEGKTPARGRKHKATEEAVAGLAGKIPGPTPEEMVVGLAVRRDTDPVAVEETFAVVHPELEAQMREAAVDPGHPFEDSIKAAKAIADDIHPVGHPDREQVNRFPISQERRAKLLNLVWERTRWRTGRVEWRDFRELLKDAIELL
jgi:hypothetical protein